MFYRRKVILALLQTFDGELEKIRLQKLLFLFTKKQTKPEYDFIPYKFGCYSYSANADMTAMVTKGMLTESPSHFKSNEKSDYVKALKEPDQRTLTQVKILYGKMDSKALMRHTYIKYPFYAIHSGIASSILSNEELQIVDKSKPTINNIGLFTIGYEGISLEEYLNRLLTNNIKLLIDVRCNAFSMKYGFSKSQLSRYCENIGIKYMHIPEVGIQSEQRQELNSQSDYDKLFAEYVKKLPKVKESQMHIFELLHKYRRVALTCFEANICQCHRKHLAEAIQALPGFDYELKHI